MKQVFSYAALAGLFLAATVGAQQPAPAPQTPPTAAPAPPAGQQPSTVPPVTFRVEINYVEVDAIVTDERGNVVTDLSAADFTVLEDGKPQKITTFARVDIPIERAAPPSAAAPPVEPDVQTNVRGVEGRVFVIMLDDLHTAPLRSQGVKLAARRFIEQYMGPNDMAAVLHTSGRAEASQDFTSNKRLLLAAVDKFLGRSLRSETLERLDRYARERDQILEQEDPRLQGVRDPLDVQRGFQARQALSTLKNVAEFMDGIRGRRKALLYIGEGISYNIQDAIAYTQSGLATFAYSDASVVRDAIRDAIGAATRANVSIYTVDPRGLTGQGDDIIEVSNFPENTTMGLDTRAFAQELRLAQDSLRVLAEQTGGVAAVNTNDYTGAFTRLVEDSSRYYVLGYYPANEKRDGRFRKIEVRVNRPGLKVRARKGYVAPRGRTPEARPGDPATSAAIREALSSPLPINGLPMTVTMAPFKGTPPNASVAIALHLFTGDFKFAEKNGAFANDLEVSFWALDATGKLKAGDRNVVNMTLKPDTLQRVRQHGFRVVSQVDLPPGRYSVRVAAHESGGRVGSVVYDLEVPDFAKAPMSVSGIALTSASAGLAPTARVKDDAVTKLLPAPPTTFRAFLPQDEIAAYAEIYDNTGPAAHKVQVAATVRDDTGRTVFQSQEERSSDELQGSKGGYGFNIRIPLRDFKPGLYVLRIEGTSRLGAGASAAREIQFRVAEGGASR